MPILDNILSTSRILALVLLVALTSALLQPHFEGIVRSSLTLPKMGLGSRLGFLKTQSVITGVKTPCIEVFFIFLKRF
jgi:hypothetical protein